MGNFIISIFFISSFLKKIKLEKEQSHWLIKALKGLQGVTVVCLVLEIVTDDKYDLTFKFLSFLIMSVLLYWLWQNKEDKLLNTLFIALFPFYVASSVLDLLKYAAPNFEKENSNYLGVIALGTLIWLVVYVIIASKQRKEIEKEIEKNRIILAEKKHLEVLVNERTSEILNQKIELEKTLEQLQATQAQLIQSEKLASLGELTAGIAHEIQNPLNFVNNFSEVSEELLIELEEERNKTPTDRDTELETDLLKDLKENLNKIHHHGKRASGIVKSMLEHSRSSDGNKELVNINQLADEYLRLAYHGLRAKDRTFNAKLETNFEENLPEIKIVTQDIGRVLLNIINNAFQSPIPANASSDYIKTVKVTTKKTEKDITIIISDNGSGVPEEIKSKIFQPFFTTKPTGKGTGLGLSLAYDIINAHGGVIKLENSNEVTSFVITLPIT